ncbi:MAG: glycosyltransferase, partial [Candidatus Pacebacteria bacterium]|nr:glycosyltransferase [Candidatus Paceibacterota bacterium]
MKEEKYIFMSVVIPVYNDPAGIVITLNSLISQNYPKEKYEIIVVDN